MSSPASLRFRIRVSILVLLVFFPAPFFALLCRGHTPSRFENVNLPVWERRPPLPAPSCHPYRLTPPQIGTVQVPDNPWIAALMRRGETHPENLRAEGLWLEAACPWGRTDRALAARQDHTANDLMTAQSETGQFEVSEDAEKENTPEPLPDLPTQEADVRGLQSYYALTHRPAALYAALAGGGSLLDAPLGSDRNRASVLVRLFQDTADTRFLAAARRDAWQSSGVGLCTLYEATGHPAYLAAACKRWKQGEQTPVLAAELSLLTGRAEYASALNAPPPDGPALARAAWTLAPHGFAVTIARDCSAHFTGVSFSQRTFGRTRTIIVSPTLPKAFTLRVFLPRGPMCQITIDGKTAAHQVKTARYALLVHRWHTGDVIQISPELTPSARPYQSRSGT